MAPPALRPRGQAPGYALDLLTPARYVATALEGAALEGAALEGAACARSVAALAVGFRVPHGDLSRVRQHERLGSDREATEWVVRRALDGLGRGVTEDADGWRLAAPFANLRFQRRKVHRLVDDQPILRDAFNPMSGAFAANIRADERGTRDTTAAAVELRESLQTFGWLPHLPAIKDERGVVLVGHRRLRIAKELGITPVVHTVRFGRGDAQDAARLKLAIGSNLGAMPLGKTDRERIARYLYAEQGWSMARIGEALQVATGTVSRDLQAAGFAGAKHTARGGRGRRSYTDAEAMAMAQEYAAMAAPNITAIGVKYGKAGNSGRTFHTAKEAIAHGQRLLAAQESAAAAETAPSPAPAAAMTLPPEPAAAGPPSCVCPACGHVHQRRTA